MKPLTFVRMCKLGIASPEDIDLFIDAWHECDALGEIYEYLGMTREQYVSWVHDPDYIHQIIEEYVV